MRVRMPRTRVAGWAAVVAGVAVGGCANLIGADEYIVGSAGSGGSTTGASGSGSGTGGAGGATDASGGAGAGGGAGASGGSAGAGAGASGGMAGVGMGGSSAGRGGGGAGGGPAGAAGQPVDASPPDAPNRDGGVPPPDAPPVDGPSNDGPTGVPGAGESLCPPACPTGLSCLNTAFGPPGMCTYSCETAACDADHDCIHSTNPMDMFPLSCVKKCPTGTCPMGFLCVPISTGDVCLPTAWFDGLGVGDDCFADAQCVSGMCRNKPNGWCSKPCGPADALCAHDAVEFRNRHGELNWCVTNLGSLACVAGCDVGGATTCANYQGTTCTAITDITGQQALGCMP